jgi:hypothetical protein
MHPPPNTWRSISSGSLREQDTEKLKPPFMTLPAENAQQEGRPPASPDMLWYLIRSNHARMLRGGSARSFCGSKAGSGALDLRKSYTDHFSHKLSLWFRKRGLLE